MYSPYKDKYMFSASTEGGLGDKLLHMVGSLVFCEYKKYTPILSFNVNVRKYDWGDNIYNSEFFIFDFENASFIDTKINNSIYAEICSSCSSSISPYPLYTYLKDELPLIDFKELSNKYEILSKKIKPSEIIKKDIPKGLENSYGIHLRKSDKISANPILFHENTQEEFDTIIFHLLKDIQAIIQTEIEMPSFLLVSEDDGWRSEFQTKLQLISEELNKPINIIEIHYDSTNPLEGYKSVLDMFCLSKCKQIFQGVKYSTFSMASALIGDVPIINYAHLLDSYNVNWLHAWSSALNINGHVSFESDLIFPMTFDINIEFNNAHYNI